MKTSLPRGMLCGRLELDLNHVRQQFKYCTDWRIWERAIDKSAHSYEKTCKALGATPCPDQYCAEAQIPWWKLHALIKNKPERK